MSDKTEPFVLERLTRVETRQESHGEMLRECLDEVKGIGKLLRGNGDAGIVTRVELLEAGTTARGRITVALIAGASAIVGSLVAALMGA